MRQRLPRLPRADAQHEHQIQRADVLLQRLHRRLGLECYARALAERANLRERASEIETGLFVHRDAVRACLRERLEIALGLVDHQVHVDREPCGAPRSLDRAGAKGEMRREASVHDVHVHAVCTARLDIADLTRQMTQIGTQDRGRY